MARESTGSEAMQAMIAIVALALLLWAVGAWVAAAPREEMVFTGHGMTFVRAEQVDHLRAQHPP